MRAAILFVLYLTYVNGQGCGNQTYQPHTHNPSARIIGGREAVPHSWPWQVDLKFRTNLVTCGGSLIRAASGNLFVLTAAQCLDGTVASDWQVYVGVHSLSAMEPYQRTYNVRELVPHQNYTPYYPYYAENDIGIIKLSENVVESNAVYPICLTTLPSSDFWGQDCVLTGWGTTVQSEQTYSDRLREVYKPVLNDTTCSSMDLVGAWYNPNTMMCAGFLAGGEGACQGDNGGPLACKNSNGQWDIVGMVSWGNGCAQAGYPAVYANVHRFRDWIAENTKDI